MATSAIGPGFLTQTAVFTNQMKASLAFAILVAVALDISIQLNVWRVIGVAGVRAQELGNRVLPGLGWFLAALIAIGGMVFNIGNVAGSGLGTDAMLGLDPKIGGTITAAVAIVLFLSKRAGAALDRFLVVLGLVMIAMTVYVAIVGHPPVGQALQNTVMPEHVNWLVITTLLGGTVGGYISYAGAHRMLDSGHVGPEAVGTITRSALTGTVLTAIMRSVLFLAVLGVVAGGVALNINGNPAAEAFQAAAGQVGLRIFGVVLWAAALSSVIGCSYTSATFLIPNDPKHHKLQNLVTIGFILLAWALFMVLGAAPAALLVFAGAFNGLVLPIGFTLILFIAAFRSDLLHGYRYPRWLIAIGVLAAGFTWWLAWLNMDKVFTLLAH